MKYRENMKCPRCLKQKALKKIRASTATGWKYKCKFCGLVRFN